MTTHAQHTPDKPFIVYAGIDKVTIGNGQDGKAYDVPVELVAAAPRMLELLKLAQVRLFMLDGENAEYEAIDALLTELGVTNK